MQLTMTGEYAIRTMVHLSSLPPGTIAQIADISEKWDIPDTFLRKIVARLVKSGLIRSHRGINGGISLGRLPENISLLEVVEQIDGAMSLNRCVIDPTFCTRTKTCVVHGIWCEAQSSLRSFLAAKTFAQIAAASAATAQDSEQPQ